MNEKPLESATGRFRADIRGSEDAGWQFAILLYRPDRQSWWPVLRYHGIFPTRDAVEVEALSVLEQMEQPLDQHDTSAASGRDRAIAMAVATAERIAQQAGGSPIEPDHDGTQA